MPETKPAMKAVRIARHGGREVLDYGDVPRPTVGCSDVLVRVLATSTSGWDVKYRVGGLPALPGRRGFPLPMQPGRDAAGIVEAVGDDVTLFRPGDRVVGLVHPANPASPLTIRGFGNLSTDIDYPGHTMFGGNAQYVARPETYWLPLPGAVTFEQAAAALWSYASAHRILRNRLEVGLGDTLLIVGASGGMGSATRDLARAMGVRVVATTRAPAKAAMLRADGTEVVVLGAGDDGEADRIRAAGGALGLDGAVDYSGDSAMVRLAIAVLRPGGTLVIVAGEANDAPLPVTAADCVRLELNLRGARASTLDDQRIVLAALAHGTIHPVIHAILPMSRIRDAHAMIENGEVMGRILLDPWQ